jgi:hypothetical protein
MPGRFRFPSNTRLAAILVDIVGSSSDLLLHFARNERVPVYLNRQIRFRRGNFQMKGSQPLWLRIALTSRRLATSFVQIIGEAFQTYGRINGEQCAASFAYYAFFSLFPLILLLVVVGTFFIPDRLQAAVQVVKQVEEYVPLQAKDKAILVDTIVHTIQNGWSAGIFGILALVWGGLRFFSGSGHRRQPSLGIQGLQLVETSAQESFHDRYSNQRSCFGPNRAADLQRSANDSLHGSQLNHRRVTDDSSAGNSFLRLANVL